MLYPIEKGVYTPFGVLRGQRGFLGSGNDPLPCWKCYRALGDWPSVTATFAEPYPKAIWRLLLPEWVADDPFQRIVMESRNMIVRRYALVRHPPSMSNASKMVYLDPFGRW